MGNKILDGFKFGFGIFLFFGLIFGIVFAVGFHTADEILPGTFSGNYSFINGNVGIGISNPLYKLDVSSNSFFRGAIYLGSDNSANLRGLISFDNGNSNILMRATTGNSLHLGANNNENYLVIKTDGNVGIGTTTPITKLHVNGNISAKAICDETGSNCQDLSNPSSGGSYTLIDVNGGAAVGLNQRIVLTNPFGINTPVIVQAEIYRNSMWAASNFVLANGYGGVGVMASYVNGTGIVVQTGNQAISTLSNNDGTAFGTTGNINSAPIRVHVWKLG